MVTIQFNLTNDFIKNTIITSGKSLTKNQSVSVDLEELSKEERNLLVKFGNLSNNNSCITINAKMEFESFDVLNELKNIESNEIIIQNELKKLTGYRCVINNLFQYLMDIKIFYDDIIIYEKRINLLNIKDFNIDEIVAKCYQGKLKKLDEDSEVLRIRNQEYDFDFKLKEWLTKNGSEELKLKLFHNQNWKNKAIEEYCLSIYPEYKLHEYMQLFEYNDANETQLKLLTDEIKKYPTGNFKIVGQAIWQKGNIYFISVKFAIFNYKEVVLLKKI